MRLHPAAVLAVAEFGGRYTQARVTPDQVRAIRDALAAGQRTGTIAAAFGISRSAVWRIASGRRWAAVK